MKKCKKDQHKLNWNECGYGGGPTADVLCDRCDKMIQIPVEVYKQYKPYLYMLWLSYENNDSVFNED